MIERNIYRVLTEWKNDSRRMPLLIRGARHVGKTFIIREFGRKEYSNCIVINFERNPEFINVFSSLDPKEIIEKIVLLKGESIKSGETLLFFDEIQECPDAIMALRYFYEEIPDIHVIAAGSLLEFALNKKGFKMPVGRVQYLYMHPLGFDEFLDAMGESVLKEFISVVENLSKIDNVLHRKLINLVRKYFILGGMPAVVNEYVMSGDIKKCQRIQRSIIDTYMDDFGKYSTNSKIKYLKKVFYAASSMIGQKFVYSKVDNSIRSREFKEAVEMLETAGVLIRVRRTNGEGLPLEANVKDNFFKILFLDVGLLHNIAGIYGETIREENLASVFKGAVAEQFVGMELLTLQDPVKRPSLFYWAREAKNSNAEIDYLITAGGNIMPVEVKSGSSMKLRSMKLFMEKYNSKSGIKISQDRFSADGNITSVPFYGIFGFLKSQGYD